MIPEINSLICISDMTKKDYYILFACKELFIIMAKSLDKFCFL